MATFAEQKRFISKLRPDYTPAVLDALGAEYASGLYDSLLRSQDAAQEIELMQIQQKREDAWANANGRGVSTSADAIEEQLEAVEHKRLNAWRPVADARADAFDPGQPLTPAGLLYERQKALLAEVTDPQVRAALARALIASKAELDATTAEEERKAKADKVAEDERKFAAQAARERAGGNAIASDQPRGDAVEAELEAIEDKRLNAWRTG